MSLIERAAQSLTQEITAACAQTGGSCNGTPDGMLAVNATFDPRAVARAVLRALREPAPEMIEAAMAHWGSSAETSPVTAKARGEIFTVMIDAALTEGGRG